MTPREQVAEFHRAFGCATNERWTPELGMLRAKLIVEEFRELDEAMRFGPCLARIAQELADLAYVTIGTAIALGTIIPAKCLCPPHDGRSLREKVSALCLSLLLGEVVSAASEIRHVMRSLYYIAATRDINLDAAITAVHEANMRKLGPDGKPILRADGKVMKPVGWAKPDMSIALVGTS